MKFDKKIIYSALLASSFMMAEDLGYYSQLQDRKIVVAPSDAGPISRHTTNCPFHP